ncbi:YhcN/YlaJ family sporulation lipoprotein [Salipaludibacillus sp. CF4.18]|uniref:YhcN/YlaJ family sporulation lipoprotein n=1 Tax=Salipaludibacillus sp. CF4.18 TaxID=3373081 RepID=UPI003EE6AB90
MLTNQFRKSCGFFLVLSILLTGCGDNMEGFNFMNGSNEQSHAINKENVGDTNQFTQYGFERHSKKEAQEEEVPGYAVYDRPLLAESISEMSANLKNVHDAGVLVTGQHVLIAFEHSSEDREAVAEQVRKTAKSVVPDYYDIYVSDDVLLMEDIESFEGESSRDIENMRALEQIIERMKNSPQGDLANESAQND